VQVVDANVLVYAVNEDAPAHEAARRWLNDALSGREPVGFAWVVLLAFLRLSTRPGLSAHPLDLRTATAVVESWLGQPPAVVLHPTPRHLGVLAGLIAALGSGGNLVNDAHLAALAAEYDGRVVSFDTDFGRLPGVRWTTP
jgi:toxin-antitoxin system PIN domain toxin